MEDKKESTPPEPPPPVVQAPQFPKIRKIFGEESSRTLGHASAAGLTFVVAIIIGMGLGWWLDQKLGTSPKLLLAGLFLGIAAGFKNLYTLAVRLDRQTPPDSAEKKVLFPTRTRDKKDDH